MREIKFRAWSGPWSSGKYRMVYSGDLREEGTADSFNFDNGILMQYTGLKDKNGQEIYEGDILKIDDDWEKWGFASGFVGYVIYDKGTFKLKEGEIYAPAYRLDSAAEEGATVIGNIYENPSLLEGDGK